MELTLACTVDMCPVNPTNPPSPRAWPDLTRAQPRKGCAISFPGTSAIAPNARPQRLMSRGSRCFHDGWFIRLSIYLNRSPPYPERMRFSYVSNPDQYSRRCNAPIASHTTIATDAVLQ
jgi:hypothetical protein